jgi:hypothetical protein
MSKKIMSLPIKCLSVMLGLVIWSNGSSNSAQAQATIPQSLMMNCGNDIKQFCSAITPGGGRIVSCLFANNDKITGQCTFAMYEASERLAATMAALGQLAKNTSCRSDLKQYCRGIPSGGGRLYTCLRSNRATLTDGCRAAMPKAETLLRRAGII